MNSIFIPQGYKPILDEYDTQRAIAYIKDTFQDEFASALNLKRVSAPLFVTENSGLNDNLNGYERAVSFEEEAPTRLLRTWNRFWSFHPLRSWWTLWSLPNHRRCALPLLLPHHSRYTWYRNLRCTCVPQPHG